MCFFRCDIVSRQKQSKGGDMMARWLAMFIVVMIAFAAAAEDAPSI
jgi:hypothetical protein